MVHRQGVLCKGLEVGGRFVRQSCVADGSRVPDKRLDVLHGLESRHESATNEANLHPFLKLHVKRLEDSLETLSMSKEENGYGSIEGGHELEVEPETDRLLKSTVGQQKRTGTLFAVAAAALVVFFVAIHHAIGPFNKSTAAQKAGTVVRLPETPLWFEQIVDHNAPHTSGTYLQKYFETPDFFGGPGHPIFVIMAGEDAVEYMLYPFISHFLGKRYKAHSIGLEHRFYGDSLPVPLEHATNDDLHRLLSPWQALEDSVNLIQWKAKQLGCGPRGTPEYCPVLTVGGSYPGFLAGLLRILYPEVIDIGYASSAPLNLYSHDVDQFAYFDKITQVAEQASTGCADAVRQTLDTINEYILDNSTVSTIHDLAKNLGICTKTIPDYIVTRKIFAQEVMMVLSTRFAEYNMGFYPPTEDQELIVGCKIFQNDKLSDKQKVSKFLRMEEGMEKCFDMTSELPPGKGGTISASDWSGVGDGPSGWMWDYQSCTLIPECGFSEQSMFPYRRWTLDWLTEHCQSRFDYTPQPEALVNAFHFDNLANVTRLLFTNGIHDGWSIASIAVDVSESVKVVNFVNGAHHSDLTHEGPMDYDTWDMKQGQAQIQQLVGEWLEQVWAEQGQPKTL